MSTEVAQLETPTKSQKTPKFKDKSAKKSSKKRRHEDQEQEEAPTSADVNLSPIRSKRQRTLEPEPSTEPQDAYTEPQTTQSWQADAKFLDAHTPFVQQTSSLYLPLAPVAHSFALAGLCAEHLSPLLLTYYPPLRGILLSYTNPRLSESPHRIPASIAPSNGTSDADDEASAAPTPVLAKAVDEYAVTYVWVTADFVVLRPTRGSWIEGYVNLQNESYLGIICWNYFNAGIEARRLPKDWTWVASGSEGQGAETGDGWFVDGQGKKVEGTIRFRVRDYEAAPATERERGFVSIEGTLLDKEDDAKLDDEIRQLAKGSKRGKKLGRLPALNNE